MPWCPGASLVSSSWHFHTNIDSSSKIYLLTWTIELEGGRQEQKKEPFCSCWFFPQMVTMARGGPIQSQELLPGLSCWCRDPRLGSPSAAFLSTSARSLIRHGAADSQIAIHMVCWCCRQHLIALAPAYKMSLISSPHRTILWPFIEQDKNKTTWNSHLNTEKTWILHNPQNVKHLLSWLDRTDCCCLNEDSFNIPLLCLVLWKNLLKYLIIKLSFLKAFNWSYLNSVDTSQVS